MALFRELHQPGKPFVLANAWDVGSARMLAALGAQALATTSAGHAFTLGRPDMGTISRAEAIEHGRELIEATDLPVSGDLENGFGHDPQSVCQTVQLAFEAGFAGCGIEDTRLPDTEPYEFNSAVERIEAAAECAKGLKEDFVLTARADGLMNGHYDLGEAIRRVQAFERVGADVVYIPLLSSLEDVAKVCKSVSVPVNVLCTRGLIDAGLTSFASAGVARISLGSMLARVTHAAILKAAEGIFNAGDFSLLGNAASGDVIDQLLAGGSKLA